MTAARATGLATLALLAAACPVAEAGPPGRWTRITGAGQPVRTTLDVGLARAPGGSLHVLWERESPASSQVLASALSRDARRLAPPARLATYDGGVNDSLALVAAPGGLRAFFAGVHEGSPLDRVMATAASDGRGRWTRPEPASNRTPARTPYAGAGIAAAAPPAGAPVSAWGSPGSGYHVGLDPNAPDGSFPGGSATDPGAGVDSAAGQVVLAWNLLDEGGVAAMPVVPAGPRLEVPAPVAPELGHRVAVTGRLGRPGVYVAYLFGGNQFLARPALWRVGDARGLVVSRTRGARDVGVAAAPGGRLWLFWHRDGALYATRSDPSARRFGVLRSLSAPRGTREFHDLAGEGSRGPLDLLALVTRRPARAGHWHQRLFPGLSLTARRRRGGRLVLRVTDAGVPVRAATVAVARIGRRRTGSRGTAVFRLPRGAYRVRASMRGYAPASLRLRGR